MEKEKVFQDVVLDGDAGYVAGVFSDPTGKCSTGFDLDLKATGAKAGQTVRVSFELLGEEEAEEEG